MKKFYKILGFVVLGLFVVVLSGYIYFNTKYPMVNAPKDLHVEITPERVERGKYLFNHVAGCADCHTPRDLTSFGFPPVKEKEGMGGMKFGKELGVPGTVYSKNITPAALKNWTDGEILRALVEGISKDGTALFPMMPYESFRNMAEEDLYAIIAYMRTMPAIENNVPESDIDFPVSMLIKMAPQVCETLPKSAPDKNNTVEYGKYLVNTVASCWHCHSPQEDHKIIPGKEMSGGTEIPISQFGVVRSANLTPDKETGIGAWTKADFIKRFKDYNEEGKFPKVGPEDFNTIMPWAVYKDLKEEDLGAIYDYLMSLPAVKNKVEKFSINKF